MTASHVPVDNRPFKICSCCKKSMPAFAFSKSGFDAACVKCDTAQRAAKQREALPCLYRNISAEIKNHNKVKPVGYLENIKKGLHDNINQFTTAHKKSEFCLTENVKSFIDYFGLEKCGFFTLTFPTPVYDRKEAQRRFNSLNKHFISKYFDGYIKVMERHKSGAVHYHLIVACKHDIRRGFNFREVKARNYRSACYELKNLWNVTRENLYKYGFGRAELMPVKTNSKGLARYVAKYLGKHIENRIEADKHARLVQTSLDKSFRWKRATANFAFVSDGSTNWRKCLSRWVKHIESYLIEMAINLKGWVLPPIDHTNYSEILTGVLGCKWAYANLDTILSFGD